MQIAPEVPIHRAHLGEAELRAGHRAEAKRIFRESLECYPGFTLAMRHLFALHVEEGELAEARNMLRRMEGQLEPAEQVLCALWLECTARAPAEARALLERLCLERALAPRALENGADMMESAGMQGDVHAVLEAALPAGRSEVGALWIRRWTRDGAWSQGLARLLELAPERESTLGAACAYLEAAAQAQAFDVARRLVREREPMLRRDPEAWAAVGRLFLLASDHEAVVHWCSDWQRADALPWALLNLGQALRELGRRSAANAVARRALELAPDHTSPWHCAWLAADHFLAGDLVAARAELERARPGERTPYQAHLFRMLELALELQQSPAPRRAFPGVRRAIAQQVKSFPSYRRYRSLRQLHDACIAAVARRRGGLVGRAWRLLRRWR